MKKIPTIILSFLLFMLVLTMQSQTDLYVSNNANTFIYVDGDGLDDQSVDTNNAALFVTNGIDLAGANSSIYLRDGAQLIQSNSSGNQGVGQLSIYQTGTANNFSYNYWGSPVGNTNANNTNNRDFIPEDSIYDVTGLTTSNLATYTTGYDGATAPLVISNRWLYKFEPGETYADWDYIGESGNAAPGYGFTMKGTSGSGSSQLYDFRGKPNTGTITVPVLAPVAGNAQFTLMGNPYPSAIDMVDFFHDVTANNSADFSQLLFWQQQSSGSHYLDSYVGGYGIYTISTGGVVSYTAAPRDTYDPSGNVVGNLGDFPEDTPGVDAPGRYLPVGQGFMVEGTANGNIEFRDSFRRYWKEASGGSHFFNPGSNSNTRSSTSQYAGHEIPESWMRFRVLIDIEAPEGYFSRELLVNFTAEASDTFNFGLEAYNSDIKPSDGYFTEDDSKLSILAKSFDITTKLPLGIVTDQSQNLGIRVYALQNFPDDMPIYLHDIEEQTYTDLRVQGFSTQLNEGTFENRFEIVFENEDNLSEEDILTTAFSIFQNNHTSQLTILNPNSLSVSHFSLYDIAGKRVIDSPLELQSRYYFSTENLSDGVYAAQVSVDGTSAINKKVIIKN